MLGMEHMEELLEHGEGRKGGRKIIWFKLVQDREIS